MLIASFVSKHSYHLYAYEIHVEDKIYGWIFNTRPQAPWCLKVGASGSRSTLLDIYLGKYN
jgi:hypothetical protein